MVKEGDLKYIFLSLLFKIYEALFKIVGLNPNI